MSDTSTETDVAKTVQEPPLEPGHIVADDWSANWNGSVAIKITALVVWIVIIYSFVVATIMVNKISAELSQEINNQANKVIKGIMVTYRQTNQMVDSSKLESLINEYNFIAAKVQYDDQEIWVGQNIIDNGNKNEYTSITQDLSNKVSTDSYHSSKLTLFHPSFKALEQKKRSITFLIISLSILSFGLIHVFITSRVLKRPFQALEEASRRVINGDLSIRMDTRRQDEFGKLANFFNNMLERVQQDKNEIDGINANLEKIVNERTKELIQTNSELGKTLAYLQDTQKQLMKSELEAELANEAKSQFLANMSHEIRTPMNSILGYTQILQRDESLNEDQKISIDAVNRSGNHLLGLINDILDISKIEAGRMELNFINFDLHQLIRDISSMFKLRCEVKNIAWHINTDAESDGLAVRGDEGKLRQVLINLLSNAVKFTNIGGVTLNVQELENNKFLFEVTDTGPGITEQEQKTIFNTFHQDKQGIKKGGTGLGLAISKKQIKLMEGELKVESTLGKGARFYFVLPLDKATGAIFKAIPKQPAGRLRENVHIKALVVDDIMESCEVLSKMLSDMGVEIKQAKDGYSSILIAEEFKPDVIFMDYNMPRMNGIDAIDNIRQRLGNSFKAIIVTAHAFDQDTQKFRVENVDDVIAKPYTIEAIASCLVRHLNVEFETKDNYTPDKGLARAAMEDVATSGIPQKLTQKLKEAVEFNIITDIEDISRQIGQADEKFQPFAKLLEKYIREFDMPAIRKLVGSL